MRLLLALLLAAFAVAPAAQAQGTPVSLSVAEYRALNVFLSNFAEASLEPFRQGQLTDDAKIRFALLHTYWNASGGGQYSVTHARANELSRRYFGAPISRPRSGDTYAYANGRYSTPPWDGEPQRTAHASNVRRLPSGEIVASVDVYVLQELFSDSHDAYGQSAEQMQRFAQNTALSRQSAGVEFERRLQARMRQITEVGRSRYVLLEWK